MQKQAFPACGRIRGHASRRRRALTLRASEQVVKMLLGQGVPVDVESENHQKIRPIHWAALRCVLLSACALVCWLRTFASSGS